MPNRNRKRTGPKRTKYVVWVCDQESCGASNIRKIKAGHIIFDDKCDKCDHVIHEPIAEEIKT